jgi:threonine dehydrogenase-like Zn-dependent dehydrogenase
MTSQRALVLSSFEKPVSVESIPKPVAKAGEVVVRVLATHLVPYSRKIFDGSSGYPLSLPMVPGSMAIGRIEDIGPDAVSLTKGQLVFCDVTIRGRDDPNVSILFGTHAGVTPASRTLMDGEWRHSTLAEFARFPLENVFPLDEDRLINKMKYTVADLCYFAVCMIPYGGLNDISLQPGETLIVAPSTGRFGGAAVTVGLALGARVIAAGRNSIILDALESCFKSTGRLQTVQITGDMENDTAAMRRATPGGRGADAYIDFSPPSAGGSTHIKSALAVLRTRGRCALMGGIGGDIEIPYIQVMFKNLQIQGRFMYDRSQVTRAIDLLESGNLKLGKAAGVHIFGPYGLEDIEEALDAAVDNPAWGNEVVVIP